MRHTTSDGLTATGLAETGGEGFTAPGTDTKTLSWDLHLADAGDRCVLRDVKGQQQHRVRFGVGLHRPPDLVSAKGAGCERRVVS